MSYARFGWEGSDVYVYADVNGSICCAACALGKAPDEPGLFGLSFPPSWYTPTRGPVYDPSKPRDRQIADVPRAAYDEMLSHLREHADAGHSVPTDAWIRLQQERDEVSE